MANYSRIQKVLGVLGLWVGSKSAPVQVAGPTGTLHQNGVAISASAAEIDRACDVSARIVNLTAASLALTELTHDGKVITINKADGTAITLPAATGSGAKFTLVIGTTITSSSTTIKVVGNDIMTGVAVIANDTDASSSLFETAADSDTITLNGSTTGGIKGMIIELIDIAADTWLVKVLGSATGSEATPFSATVS